MDMDLNVGLTISSLNTMLTQERMILFRLAKQISPKNYCGKSYTFVTKHEHFVY